MAAALEKVFSQFNNLLIDIEKERDEESLIKAFSMEVTPINYDTIDEETDVRFRLELDGIDTHPDDQIYIDIQPWSLEVKIKSYVRQHFLKIGRFYAEIDAKKSHYIKSGGFILFKLRKVIPGKWNHLSYHHPEVVKNFKKSFEDFVPSSTILRGHDCSHLIDIWVVEMISVQGIDFRSCLTQNGVDIPLDVITIDQIREFLKSYDQPSSSHLIWLATSFFLCEKKKFEELHPEVLIEYDGRPKPKNSTNTKAEQLRQKGLSAFRSKRYLDAIDAFSAAIKLTPQNPTYYMDRADVYTFLKVEKNSLDDIARALILDPFNSKAYFCMGKIVLSSGMRKEMNNSFLYAKILDPLNQEIDKQIIQTYKYEYFIDGYIQAVRYGDEKKKSLHLKSILDFIELSVVSDTLMRSLLDRGLIAEARIEASKLCSLRPYPEYMKHSYLALCAYYEDDERKFNEHFRKAKRLKVNHEEEEEEYCEFIALIYVLRKRGDEMYKKGTDLGYLEAIRIYREILDNPEVCPMLASKLYFMVATCFFLLRNAEEAILYLGGAIGKRSDFHDAFRWRGELYMMKKEFEKALKDFEKAHEISPCSQYQELINKARSKQGGESSISIFSDKCPSHFKEISDNFSQKESQESKISRFQDSISKKEEGNRHFMAKRYKEAIQLYTEAIELDPDNSLFYLNRAGCYILLKDYEEGFYDAEMAVGLDPNSLKGFLRLGKCSIALGKLDEGGIYFEKAKKLNSRNSEAIAGLTSACALREVLEKANDAFHRHDYTSAACFYSSVLEKAEACVLLRLKRIQCLVRVEEYDQALSEAELATSLDPTNSDIFGCMGLCYFCKGETWKAIECFESTWSLDTSDAWLDLIKRLAQYKDPSLNSNPIRSQLFSELKNQILTLLNLVDKKSGTKKGTKLKNGERNLKEQHDKGVNNLNSNSTSDSRGDLQVALYHIGRENFREALQHSKKAVNKDDTCLEGLILIGKCNTVLGNVEEAVLAFERAKKIDPKNEQIIEGIKRVLELKKLLNDAGKAVEEKQFLTAYELYNSAFKIAYRNSALLLSIAECLIGLGRFSELNFTWSLCDELQLSPEFLCINSLIAYYQKGNCSMTFLHKALALDPSNLKFQKYLNILQSVDEIKTKALKAIGHDLVEALSLFQEALRIDTTNPLVTSELYYYIGFVFLKRDIVVEAVEYFSKAICKREKYVLALEKRALCYRRLGRFEDAVNDYLTLYKCQNDLAYKQLANDTRNFVRKGF